MSGITKECQGPTPGNCKEHDWKTKRPISHSFCLLLTNRTIGMRIQGKLLHIRISNCVDRFQRASRVNFSGAS